MKLWAISDLHVGYKKNLLAIGEFTPRPDDWLVLCGDVGDSLEQIDAEISADHPTIRLAREGDCIVLEVQPA